MLHRIEDTIVAVSSAPGFGAVGVVRLSGGGALSIADRMAAVRGGAQLSTLAGSRRAAGEVRAGPDVSLPAWFYVFRAPHSHTRQDIVEIHTLGSPVVLEMVRRRAISLGALPAEPGEFTARAFLNGAMDLAAAEAVAGVIRARSDIQLRAARRMMDGALAARIADARDRLAELLALVEAVIDFAEEPIEFISLPELCRQLESLKAGIRELLRGAKSAERFDVLPHVLLLGPPNAGKSSLLNRLSGTGRAICAAVAGTTRDILSAPIRVGRGEAILLDAAGVCQNQDEILSRARALTLAEAQRVDLVCIVLDINNVHGFGVPACPAGGSTAAAPASPQGEGEVRATVETHTAEPQARAAGRQGGSDRSDLAAFLDALRGLELPSTVVAANKCDLLAPRDMVNARRDLEGMNLGPVVPVSALRGDGVEELRAAFADRLAVGDATVLSEAVLLSERQRVAVAEAAEALERADALGKSGAGTIDFADLLAFELREALDALGSVTGAVTTEDLLARVFANFCIGK